MSKKKSAPQQDTTAYKNYLNYLNLSDPMDCSLPGSSVYGVFQARVLEWGAIAFSNGSH